MIYFGSIKASAKSSNLPFLGSYVLFLVPFLGSLIFPKFVQLFDWYIVYRNAYFWLFKETLFVGKA